MHGTQTPLITHDLLFYESLLTLLTLDTWASVHVFRIGYRSRRDGLSWSTLGYRIWPCSFSVHTTVFGLSLVLGLCSLCSHSDTSPGWVIHLAGPSCIEHIYLVTCFLLAWLNSSSSVSLYAHIPAAPFNSFQVTRTKKLSYEKSTSPM